MAESLSDEHLDERMLYSVTQFMVRSVCMLATFRGFEAVRKSFYHDRQMLRCFGKIVKNEK